MKVWAKRCKLEKAVIISGLLKDHSAAAVVRRKAARLQSESGGDGEGPGE